MSIELYHKASKVSKKKLVAVISIVSTSTVPGLRTSGATPPFPHTPLWRAERKLHLFLGQHSPFPL